MQELDENWLLLSLPPPFAAVPPLTEDPPVEEKVLKEAEQEKCFHKI